MSYISYCLQTLQGLTNSILTLLSWMTNYLSFRYIRLGHRSLPRTEDQGKIYVSSSQYTPVTLYHFCKAVNHCIICNYVFSQTLISRHIIRMQFLPILPPLYSSIYLLGVGRVDCIMFLALLYITWRSWRENKGAVDEEKLNMPKP